MKLLWKRLCQYLIAAAGYLKLSLWPHFFKNLINCQFLIYSAVSLLLAVMSFPERFMDFDSSMLRPVREIAVLLTSVEVAGPILRQFVLLLAVYALALLLPRKIRAVFLSLFLFLIALYALGNSYMVIRYSCPAPEMVIIINSADMQEVREYFSVLFLNNKIFLFGSILFILLLPAAVWYFFMRTHSPSYPAVFSAFFAVLAVIVLRMLPGDFDGEFWRYIKAVDFLYRLDEKDFYLESAAGMVAAPQLPPGSKDALKGRTAVAGILVLGESDCRRSHSLYGYGKHTDLQMEKFSKKPGFFIFKNVISATASTQHSIYFMFSDARISDKTKPGKFAICEWFHAAGASVLWYSNQRAHGAWASMGALIFANADELKFFADGTKNTYDRIALLPPMLERWKSVKNSREPVLFGVHIMGSHYQQQFRIDPEWRENNRDKLEDLDIYDQTVVYTDDFLGTLAAEVEAVEKPAFLLYMPDHGELLCSNRSLLTPEAVYYEIPVFLYCNAAYLKAFPETAAALREACEKPYQTDLAVYLLARLMNMPEKLIPPQADILSGDYHPVPRWIGFGESRYPEKP